MPAWLTMKLFWKVLPYAAIVLFLGTAFYIIDSRGYERAEAEAVARENERKLQNATFAILLQEQTRDQEGKMQNIVNTSDEHLGNVLDALDITNTTVVKPTLVKEIANDPRLSDPAAGITDGMLRAINTARSTSARPCPAGSNAAACFTLPVAQPAD